MVNKPSRRIVTDGQRSDHVIIAAFAEAHAKRHLHRLHQGCSNMREVATALPLPFFRSSLRRPPLLHKTT